ncbi:Maf family protein, partial [Kaarinaea lacus]
QIYLASQSPRRRTLIEQMGIAYQAISVEVDERPHAGEVPADFVARLACEKAQAGWQSVAERGIPVLGADTCIVLDQQIVGKPSSQQQGIDLLKRYSGKTHQVVTGVAMVGPDGGVNDAPIVQQVRVSTSLVTFRVVTDRECKQYWQTGEPVGKAGGYAIQGKAAAFIEKIEGSYSGVMGLPLFEFSELITKFGIQLFDV